jgi:bifunctional UDP-N-acetylglucosamine pyrophosphorylase / glucosamine-1-phosphate N-acetyltransferase
MTNNIAVCILAAGKGTRMKSELPKVLAETAEKSLIFHVLDAISGLSIKKVVIVTGYKSQAVQEKVLKYSFNNKLNISFALQKEQLGTGHAVKCAKDNFADFKGTVLILCGDSPLITRKTLENFINSHNSYQSNLSMISAVLPDGASFGRIIRNNSGVLLKIVEARDSSWQELQVKEVNSGIYAVNSEFLWSALDKLTTSNQQQEYYLTDIVEKSVNQQLTTTAWICSNPEEILGVNSKAELTEVNNILLNRRIKNFIDNGVHFETINNVWIDPTVTIGTGSKIGANVHLKGTTTIGENVVIEGSAYLIDSKIASDSIIKFGVRAEKAVIGAANKIGPFAHLRPGTELHSEVKVGNFVETKQAILHDHVSASHLTYLGDCEIGSNTNIGAGVITCNYDGIKKSKTTIEEDVFVGSNSCLVAPITIGKGTTIGAGTVVAKHNVPSESLIINRVERITRKK